MQLSVALEHRFLQTPDGGVWTQTSFALPFWRRYLEVFDQVRCVARVLSVTAVPSGWQRADGDGVRFDAVPHFLGPGEFVRRVRAVRKAVRLAVDAGEAFVLRVPGNIGMIAADYLQGGGRPFGVEVVADPLDVFSPGAIHHPLRPFFRWHSTRRLREMCARACAASYVTEQALQHRYPSRAPSVAASSVELSDAAFVTSPPSVRASGPMRLVTVGSLAYLLKAPDVLIRALAHCVHEGMDLQLVVVGDGARRPELAALAAELGLAARVRFAGQLTAGAAVRAELDQADIFVLASRQEGLPRAMVEAMARGLPCVGSTVGGIPELLPPEDLVPPGDAMALARKIREIASDPRRRTAMAARNFARARAYHDAVLQARRVTFYRHVRDATEGWLRARGHQPVRLAYVTTVAETQLAFLRGQNRFLRDHGFELHAIASPGAALNQLATRDGVVAHSVPISRTISPLRDLHSVWRLFHTLVRVRPDIVHLSTPKAALLGAIAAYAARIPIRVFLMRGSITEGATGPRRALFRTLERLTTALCHQTISVAPSLLAFLRSEGIVPPERGLVLAHGMSNGIDSTRFTNRGNALAPGARAVPVSLSEARVRGGGSVGYVGRLARDKGIEELAQAWQSIRQQFPTAQLVLIGPWETEDAVDAVDRALLECDPRVHCVGAVSDVVPYYRLLDLLVFPSHGTEGFPNAPMEAAAMGLPVIATRVVGCIDAVLDGRTGTLVPPRNAEALSAAMARYLADPALRARHGSAGRDRVRRDFAPEPIWRELRREYLRLLAARRPALIPAALIGART